MSFVVPEIGADFSTDFEDLLIAYIFNNWTETNPAKGSSMQPDYESEPNTVSFKSGFPDYFRPYECAVVQTRTELIPSETFSKSKFVFFTICDVMLRMKRLQRDAIETDPQLENMETEIERIIQHYQYNDIPGIKELSFSFPDSTARVYNASDNYAKVDWRSVIRVKLFYEKENIL